MSSIIVKGMRMPKDCRECRLQNYSFTTGDTRCGVNGAVLARNFNAIMFDGRPEWCPLVEIPNKHGDLIDRDTLEPDADYDDGEFWAYSVAQVCSATTVIEAEDG